MVGRFANGGVGDVDRLQAAKTVVRRFHKAIDGASEQSLSRVLEDAFAPDAELYTVAPFDGVTEARDLAQKVWQPLREAFSPLTRRADIFLAGNSFADAGATVWVLEKGHLLGLWREPWLGLEPSGKAAVLRYATFHEVIGERIVRSALFFDILNLLWHAGYAPLPPQSGAPGHWLGPRTQDGLLHDAHDPRDARRSLDLISAMIDNIATSRLKEGREPDVAKYWTSDMVWWGPGGWGTGYTIDGYKNTGPRQWTAGIELVRHHGHVTRIAEGNYCGFFGWPSITVRPKGGFLGLPAGPDSDMRIVDIYRREGELIAENWVFIDLIHFLKMQGLDVLARLRTIPRS